MQRTQKMTVGRARFEFRGFPSNPGPLLRSRFDYIDGATPRLLEFSDAVHLPNVRCLYDVGGRRLDPTKAIYVEPGAPAWLNDAKVQQIEQKTMPEEVQIPPGLARVSEPVVLLGEVHDHYGHLITDTLSRVWALQQLDPSIKLLFAPNPIQRLDAPLVTLMFELFGIDRARILLPDGPTLFERLLCPVPALQLSRIYQTLDEPFRRAAARALAPGASRPQTPVYLTRTGLDGSDLRRPLNEEALEARLAREGFAIIHPERLSPPEQMALFNGDHPVVGPYGSAMHTVLFRNQPDGQRLGMLLPEKIMPRFAMVDAVKGSRAAYVHCMAHDYEGGQPVWSIDVDAAMAGLDAAGLLRRR